MQFNAAALKSDAARPASRRSPTSAKCCGRQRPIAAAGSTGMYGDRAVGVEWILRGGRRIGDRDGGGE